MRSAFGFSGQKCRPTAASTSSGRCRTSSTDCWCRRPRRSRSAIPTQARELARPGDQRPRGGSLHPVGARGAHGRAAAHRRRARDRGRAGQRLLRRADRRRRTCRRAIALLRDELFVPFTVIQGVDSIDEAFALSNDSVLGLTAGFYSEDKAEQQRFLDTHAKRASSTSTAEPARPPARGRASSRSAAGRARPQRASPAAASTTCSSSCGSSRRPSSTEDEVRATGRPTGHRHFRTELRTVRRRRPCRDRAPNCSPPPALSGPSFERFAPTGPARSGPHCPITLVASGHPRPSRFFQSGTPPQQLTG